MQRPGREPRGLLSRASRRVNRLAGVASSWLRRRRSDSWEEYYLRMTKRDDDPASLVGVEGQFEEMREWQFDLMRDAGLAPPDALLDLGCGVLRGGIAFVEYLDAGNYYGMDLSLDALLDGHRRVHERGLGPERPTLVRNEDLSFAEVDGVDADFMLAQSVWSHLPPDRVEECLANVPRALAADASVIATYNRVEGDEPRDVGYGVDWAYPLDWLAARAAAHGFDLVEHDPPEPHPNGQSVVRLTR